MTETTVELDNLQPGDDIAVDDIAGRGFQQVKLAGGAVDDTTLIQAGAGLTATSLRVNVATDNKPTVILDTAAQATLDAILVDTTATAAAVGGAHIDDAVFTEAVSDGVPIMGAVGLGNVDSGDAGAVGMTLDRKLHISQQEQVGSSTSGATAFDSYQHLSINLTVGANQVLVSSALSKQIWVYGIGFTCSADGTGVSFQDEDDLAISGIMTFAQYGGMAVSPCGNFEMPLWKLGTNKDLEVDVTTGDIDGYLTYAIVSV